jgi:hypothetical protein
VFAYRDDHSELTLELLSLGTLVLVPDKKEEGGARIRSDSCVRIFAAAGERSLYIGFVILVVRLVPRHALRGSEASLSMEAAAVVAALGSVITSGMLCHKLSLCD